MILSILLVIIAAALLYMYLEAGWLKVERLDFANDGTGLKILHISDLHVYLTGISALTVRNRVLAENPDLILISGDYIDKPRHVPQFLKYLSTVSRGYRTILCLGNHDLKVFGKSGPDIEKFISRIEAQKTEVLRNKTIVVDKLGKKYNIIGIDDLRQGDPDIVKALTGCIPGSPKISLTHNPDLALHIPEKSVDYMLCGHFHGGQIWMPFNLEFFLLRKDKLCRMGVKRGLHEVNGIKLYLNRGLGNVVVPMRLFSRPEILILTVP